MEMQQPQKVQNQTQDEEDVLNFDLDDISLEDIDQQAPGKEEDVIELTDLVARGMPLEEEGKEAAAEPLKEGQSSEEESFKLLGDDLVGLEPAADETAEKKGAVEPEVADFALELDLPEGEKQPPAEAKGAEEIVSSADLDAILKDEEPLELIPEKEVISDERSLEEIVSLSDLDDGAEEIEPDLPDVIGSDLLKEDGPALETAGERQEPPEVPPFIEPEKPARAPKAPGEAMEPFAAEASAPAAEPLVAGISEEKLEAIVTKVVHDVLERVARETMASVAERVISEAIESLKKSLSENP